VKVLVAGVGNVLRADDGFGVVVARRLLEDQIPDAVRVLELGIGGIHLVQDLLNEQVDGLVVIDAVDLGRPPGTVVVIEPDVLDVASMSLMERHDQLADMHYATPDRAFMLARGLEVLPSAVWVVGCQPKETDWLGEGLSPELEGSVDAAIVEVKRLVATLAIEWP
jgi:hydrogenase maturation protease